MLEPIVLALDSIYEGYNFRLNVVGPVTNKQIRKYLDREYIVHHRVGSLCDVAELLRNSHALLYSVANSACSNAVLEAISTGIPVVGFDSGSMSELCWFSKELLAPVPGGTFKLIGDHEPEALAEKIELCIRNYDNYRSTALLYCDSYSLHACGQRYVEIFNLFSHQ